MSALQFNPRNYRGRAIFYGVACGNCVALDRGSHPVRRCTECNERKPVEEHHIDGQAVSDVVIDLCINCHRPESRRRASALKFRRFRERYDASYEGTRS
jgi:hypothetical protein